MKGRFFEVDPTYSMVFQQKTLVHGVGHSSGCAFTIHVSR